MTRRQLSVLCTSLALPAIALTVLTFAAASPASAQVQCWYAGQQYAAGQCLYTACGDPKEGQRCNAIGNWDSCAMCDEPQSAN